MDVFDLRNRLIDDYQGYIRSFISIRDTRIGAHVSERLGDGLLWPEPLIQLNPSFELGEPIAQLVSEGMLHPECERVFRLKENDDDPGRPLRLHRHQVDAILAARRGANYVLTTGTGSGKSLAYIVPIVDHVLRNGSGKGIQALVVYPMNALANSQLGELQKFLCRGYPKDHPPLTFARYTGQEDQEERQRIIARPPDILLTNYVMLELILTRPKEEPLVRAARRLRFLVLDELHTYRGRQGADVAMLVRRARHAFGAEQLQCVGTSATLAGPGSAEEQRRTVAEVASGLFGASVTPEDVIGETLRRSTPERALDDPGFVANLRAVLARPGEPAPTAYEAFAQHPLSSWVESVFGLTREQGSGRLIRSNPRPIGGPEGAARQLSEATGIDEERCAEALRSWLLAGHRADRNPVSGFPVFAFRLHQFIGKGDTVYATLEPAVNRVVTLHGQVFVPGDRDRRLYPLVFCRECGQEFYSVFAHKGEGGVVEYEPRDAFDRRPAEERGLPSFLALNEVEDLWPFDPTRARELIPEEWLDAKGDLVRHYREYLPAHRTVVAAGRDNETGTPFVLLNAPFRFCPRCGVSYTGRVRTDFTKLASLASEGRSTATTILCLATVRYLRGDSDLADRARKLLSFTDNRQDASLQAGHFNDFIEIGLLRSAVYRAAAAAGAEGLEHDDLAQAVFRELRNLGLVPEMYAYDTTLSGPAMKPVDRALRDVLGYRVYRDLQRGWRVTSPNLEQCGLLELRYESLDELSRDEGAWEGSHPALRSARPETRARIAKVLLDHMRRELAIDVDYLEEDAQERIRHGSQQSLISPWGLDENEPMEHAFTLLPRSRREKDYRGYTFLSARGGFGQFLRRRGTLPEFSGGALSVEETQQVVRDLLEVLRHWGLVARIVEPRNADDVPGYQVRAQALRWHAGDGTRPFHDPIRVPRASSLGARVNPFFVEFYRTVAATALGLEAREHTAQVPANVREDREERFRTGKLPILYCSPTMELGVDIAELNVVNLRNVPPTPANYAQRSGRAGRSGQPALVFNYCTTGSPHDQYFFKRPHLMVAGAVSPPRLDLANEDLIRAHVHAVWLSVASLDLGSSLQKVLSVEGSEPTLELLEPVKATLASQMARERTLVRARELLRDLDATLRAAPWFSEDWTERTVAQLDRELERACERWRGLYRSARQQAERQDAIIRDHTRTGAERDAATRLRKEAEAQMNLLVASDEGHYQSDFNSYRYFASEGFLPGYSFPRLPLSAYIPARRRRSKDEFLSRPRFLAISEFGPRALVYHEGSRYIINRVLYSVAEDDLATQQAKLCAECGYLHEIKDGATVDKCERCNADLGEPLSSLLRLTNVSTKRRDRISSDEEERVRQGYEIRSVFRSAVRGGVPDAQLAAVQSNGETLATMTYAQAATIWRINVGWRRRKDKNQLGFVLDIESGYWAKNQIDEADPDDPMGPRTRRVLPYVEDTRNALAFEPARPLGYPMMAAFTAALASGIEARFQLEDGELAAVLLPSADDPRLLLLYEAAEGGAGVLRRLVEEKGALAAVAREALDICHFDPDTGADRRRAPHAREDCEAACYDCLMSYTNQPDHRVLDRQAIADWLQKLARAQVVVSPGTVPRAEHLERLGNQCQSSLEREWLEFLEKNQLALPTRAQVYMEGAGTRPDFVYDRQQAVVYVDGPHHEFPERQARDREQQSTLEDQGFLVLRFGLREDWQEIAVRFPSVFGNPTTK